VMIHGSRMMKTFALAAGFVSAGLGGYCIARAAASAATPALPLYYTGFLSQDGAAVSNSPGRDITVTLFDAGGSALNCHSPSPGSVAVSAGHFSVAMSVGDCTGVLQANHVAFVEIKVDGTPVGSRQQVGATPFSFAAETADIATTAVTATTATTAITADTATNATNASNVPLAGVTGLSARLAAGPGILGPTTTVADGDGVDQSIPGGPGRYKNLTTMCQRDKGANSFPCTLGDAARSLARGVTGNVGMGATYWLIGGDSDCRGFHTLSSTSFGTTIHFTTTGSSPDANPGTSDCSQQLPVLCCG
jgi:hypothetical protein